MTWSLMWVETWSGCAERPDDPDKARPIFATAASANDGTAHQDAAPPPMWDDGVPEIDGPSLAAAHAALERIAQARDDLHASDLAPA